MPPVQTSGSLTPQLIAAASAFIFCLFLYPFYIKWLKAKQIAQFIRQEGPASHAAKAKTPTMGGLCFIAGSIFALIVVILVGSNGAAVVFTDEARRAALALGSAVCCGLLGFADDYGKIASKSNAGLSARLRLACEFALGLVLGFSLSFLPVPDLIVPFSHQTIHLPDTPALDFAYRFLLVPFVTAATSNALNLHDGMDGLAAGTSIIVFVSLGLMLAATPGCTPLSSIAFAACGALVGFLVYNRYPAKVFMGDTGSLFIGALMSALVVLSGLVLWFVPLSLIYIVEALSVISQVTYFKLTKPYTPDKPMSTFSLVLFKLTHRLPGQGKRLLRMAPIHHHFEALAAEKNGREWQVVLVFWLAQLILASICLVTFRFAL